MNDIKIIAIGEFLWDYLPSGKKMGGAAANFAYHAKSAGAHAILVSAIGNDDNGKELVQELDKFHVPHQLQTSPNYATGKVLVQLDATGKPTYNIVNPVAWDDIQLTTDLQQLISSDVTALYFGSLIQRNLQNHQLLKTLLPQLAATTKIIVDINLRKGNYHNQTLLFCLEQAQILKLNDEELPIIADLFNIKHDAYTLFNYLHNQYRLELLIYTCGSEGSYLITENEQDYCPSEKITPVDTVGAGDSFMAIASVLYLKGRPLKEINAKANHIAAYVCTQNGPMPKMPADLLVGL